MPGLLFAAVAATIMVPNANMQMARMVNADYPSDLARAGKQGAVVPRIVVDPEGRALSCAALQTMGDARLGEAACKSFRRWRLDRPTGINGEPIYALISPIMGFYTDDGPPLGKLQTDADLQLKVRGLQTGDERLLHIQVGADGLVQHCVEKQGAID